MGLPEDLRQSADIAQTMAKGSVDWIVRLGWQMNTPATTALPCSPCCQSRLMAAFDKGHQLRYICRIPTTPRQAL